MDREERRLKRKKDAKQAAIILIVLLLLLIGLVVGVVAFVNHFLPESSANTEPSETTEVVENTENMISTETVDTEEVDPYLLQAQTYVSGMTLEQKVAQMFMITPEALTGVGTVTVAGDTTKTNYMEYPVGGIIYFSKNLQAPEQTKTMLEKTMSYSEEATGLPIFLAVDEEGGTVTRIASNMEFGVADVGDMSVIGEAGDAQNAYLVGTSIGSYLAELGFNVNFAPMADLHLNEENTVTQYRSFGSDATLVGNMVVSELTGLSEKGIYGVVKHFPGHGGTVTDSHNGAAVSEKTLEELLSEELIPFKSAIDNGAEFVMVGHISVPNITGNDIPSSLSDYMITEVLRNQLGYQGIVVTDAMDMKAITDEYNSGEAAIAAIQAGVDIILMPQDFKTAYAAVLEAVNNGTISEERIDESVARIVRVKQMM